MIWALASRADVRTRIIADRHYNRQKVGSPQFVPPGRCLVLRAVAGSAAWVTSWPYGRYVKHDWAGCRVNSLFRRESGPAEASEMILDAVAATRWNFGDEVDREDRGRWVPMEHLGSFDGKPRQGPPLVSREGRADGLIRGREQDATQARPRPLLPPRWIQARGIYQGGVVGVPAHPWRDARPDAARWRASWRPHDRPTPGAPKQGGDAVSTSRHVGPFTLDAVDLAAPSSERTVFTVVDIETGRSWDYVVGHPHVPRWVGRLSVDVHVVPAPRGILGPVDPGDFDDDLPTLEGMRVLEIDAPLPTPPEGVPEVFQEPTTDPHDGGEWLSGRERGYSDLAKRYDQALRAVLRRFKVPDDVVERVSRLVSAAVLDDDTGDTPRAPKEGW